MIFILFFQVVTFGNYQEADAHRVGNMSECIKVKVKAEVTKITIEKLKGFDAKKAKFDPGVVSENPGIVEIAYTFWEPDHQKEKDGVTMDVIELKNWYLSKHQQVPFSPSSNDKTKAFLMPKHNVYLHDTCWHDVDKFVVNLAVQSINSGDSYKVKWYNSQLGKYLASQVTENTLSTALKISPAGQAVGAVKTLIDALLIKGNDVFGADSRIYNIGDQQLRKYYTYQFPLESKDPTTKKINKAIVEFRVVILEVPEKTAGIGLPLDDSYAISSVIPSWIKQNANWWEQGLISDKDFALGLGFMVKERLIHVDNVDFDPNGGIEISDDIKIPDWIKNNARWWVDGVISDNDFKYGIQHMVKEEVISFKEKSVKSIDENILELQQLIFALDAANLEVVKAGQKYEALEKSNTSSSEELKKANTDIFKAHEITSKIKIEIDTLRALIDKQTKEEDSLNRSLGSTKIEINPENIKNLYELNKWNELTAKWLLEVKNSESKIYDEIAKDVWADYSKDKAKEKSTLASDLEIIQYNAVNDAMDLVKMLDGINNIEQIMKEYGKNNEISSHELDSTNKKIIDELNDVKPLDDLQQINDGYKEAIKSNKQAQNKKIQLDSKIVNTENKSPKDILIIKNLENVNDNVPSHLEITEKHGRFVGDPCDEESKNIKLYYKLKKSSGKPIADGIILFVNHSFEGKYLHTHDENNSWGSDDRGVLIAHDIVEILVHEELPPGIHSFEIKGANLRDLSHFSDYLPSSFIVVDVIVPPCIIKDDSAVDDYDSAVDDSDRYTLLGTERKKLHVILEEIIDDSNELNKIIDNGKKITSILDDSVIDDYLPGLDDDIEDDPLPGLDYDVTEEELREFELAGASDVGLLFSPDGTIPTDCDGDIVIDVDISNNDIVNDNIGYPIDVTLIENGPRGTVTHVVQAWVGEGQLVIKNPPFGTYSFEVKSAILQDDQKIDIYSGTYDVVNWPDNTITVIDCPDDSSVVDSEEYSSSVTSDSQCTEDPFGYGEIKVIDNWASYETDLPYYFFNVGWLLQHTNPNYQNNVNSMTVDLDMTGPVDWSPPSKTVRTDGSGNLQISWSTQNPGTYTFTITNFQNMGSYCGNGDTITLTIP